MDELEKYIQKNRDNADKVEHVPEDEMWSSISKSVGFKPHTLGNGINENSFSRNKPVLLWKRLSIAAGLLALIGWGLWFFNGNETEQSISDAFPELAEKEMYFQRLIADKEKEIGIENIDKETYKEVLDDLKMLNETTKQTKRDIFSFPDNDRAVEILIRNYELKIRILENLNRQIEKQKYHEEYEKSI